jgi:hypothetical protein
MAGDGRRERGMIAARQIAFGRGAGKKPIESPKALFSACGDGAVGSIFSAKAVTRLDFSNGFSMTVWAKRPMNTRGHFCTFGSDSSGVSIGGGAPSESESNGKYLNGLANMRWWLPSYFECINDENWHHYSFTINSGSGNKSFIYMDGEKVGEGLFSGCEINKVNYTTEITLLGCCDSPFNRCMTGLVTRACLFERYLTEVEVKADFEMGMSFPILPGLIHCYGFEGSDEIMFDSVGDVHLVRKNGAYISTEVMS